MSDTYAPFAKPVYLMAKPVGSRCNLLCAYCYYLGKSAPDAQGTPSVMSDELLEKFIREYIGMQTVPYVLFNWHGGKPSCDRLRSTNGCWNCRPNTVAAGKSTMLSKQTALC